MSSLAATNPLLRRGRGAAFLTAALFVVATALVGCTPSTETAGLPESASSSERIAAALDAGEIDKPTSLLYRTWAQFGDLSLPEQYRGAPEPHDLSVFAEVADALEEMPAEIRSQLEPFFERPSNPDSAFSDRADGAEAGASAPPTSGSSHALSVRTVSDASDAAGYQRCSQDWFSEVVPGLPFRVWACPDEHVNLATNTIAIVSDALVRARVGDMLLDVPNGMGAPIPDDPNADAGQPSDDKIDIYVLPEGRFAPYRDGNERLLDEISTGITMKAAPHDGNSSSAYILLDSVMTNYPDGLAQTLVHEVSHVLQFAHFNANDFETGWIYEASAVWAEIHYLPELPGPYGQRVTLMQNSQLSLLDPTFGHQYSAFLWFLFMDQELGPGSVFGVWQALNAGQGGASSDIVVAAISSQIDLETAFPEFVMRQSNLTLPGDPITPRFVEMDSTFPDDEEPDLQALSLTADVLAINHDGVPGLGYRYTRVTMAHPDATGIAVRVTADLETASGTAPSIEALVETPSGDYVRMLIDPSGTDVCMASDLVLVVANPSGTIDDEITGSIELNRSNGSGCAELPPTPTEAPPTVMPSDPPETVAGPTGDYCIDMLEFQSEMQGLADGSALPVSSQRVADIFALAEPHLPNVPDGGIEQVDILRSYTEQAAGQSASDAATVLRNEEFQRLTSALSFLVQYCDVDG